MNSHKYKRIRTGLGRRTPPLDATRGATVQPKTLTGFTLIEALVAAGVFVIAMMSITGIYVSVQRLNQRSAALQAIGQDARFVQEDLTKLIANGTVDYSQYPGRTVPQPSTNQLWVLDKDGIQVRVFRSGNILRIRKGPAGNTTDYTGSNVRVLNFRVFITPATDPFPVGGGSPREQPTVTVFLDLEANLGARDRVRQSFQTTAATRQYP